MSFQFSQEFVTLAMSHLAEKNSAAWEPVRIFSPRSLVAILTSFAKVKAGCCSMMHHGHLEVDGLEVFFWFARSSVLICLMQQQRHTGHVHATRAGRNDEFFGSHVAFQVLAKEGSLVRPQVRVLLKESSTHEHVVTSSFFGFACFYAQKFLRMRVFFRIWLMLRTLRTARGLLQLQGMRIRKFSQAHRFGHDVG